MKYTEHRGWLLLTMISVSLSVVCSVAEAQTSDPASTAIPPSTSLQPPSEDALKNDQLAISGRYARFERMLSQMADILGREDPERADLLRRAISKGREQRVGDRIEGIVKLMESREFGTVVEEQQQVTAGLMALLKLLQSEDRRSSVEKERERLNALLKDVRNLIAEERSARAATQNSAAPSNTAPQQQKAIDKADAMLREINQNDARSSDTEGDGGSKDAENGKEGSPTGDKPASDDGKSQPGTENKAKEEGEGDGKSEPVPGEDAKGQSEPKPTDTPSPTPDPKSPSPGDSPPSSDSQSPGESQSPSESPSGSESQSQQQGGKPQSEQSPKEQKTPGREQIQQARQMMQEALDQLKQQQKDPAIAKQDEAIRELHEAAAKLEEMLRQLREEEKEMLLAALEARFQRMLAVQTQIHEGTLELAATPKENWLDVYFGRCRELSQQQIELTSECAQTSNLLREDGTSVSILLAVEDIESDMGSVAGYLRESRVGTLTQAMQTDIIESLKQLIEATQQEMEDMKSEERQQNQQQSNDGQKPPLVELMAEIKVLRSLQLRVNRRTRQVDELIQKAAREEQSDLVEQVSELADRQQRLRESAAELARQARK